MTLRLVHPAPLSAGLESAGARPRLRKALLMQIRRADSLAIYDRDEVLCVVMFRKHGWRRVEYAMAITAAAAPFMRRLIRIAQLTLANIGQDRLVVASIHPANAAGQRMARMVGFRPALRGPLWVFRKGQKNGQSIRQRPGTTRTARTGGASQGATASRQ